MLFAIGIKILHVNGIKQPSRDVSDVHEVLEITVYDDNKDHKYSFLGKVQLRIIKKINILRSFYHYCG